LRLGQRGTLSLWSDATADVEVDVAGYVIGRPAVPDPVVASAAPGAQGSDSLPAFDGLITDFLRADGVPGASVAVAVDGRIVYARAYGTADPATGAPVDVDSRFRLASLSKVLTGAAVLNLAQAGRLNLDAPAFPLIAGAVPVPPGADGRLGQVTMRDLLDHTSGLPASPDVFFGEGSLFPKSCADAARWVVTRPLVADPGTRFSYVNMNYCVLSLVVEAVTGQPYLTALQHLVLDPRGVHDVALGASDHPAAGEVASPTGNPATPGVGWFMESLLGAGGLIGTPADLVRVVDGLDPAKPGEHLLAPDEYAAMATPGPGGWGLGVRLFEPGTYGHTGSLAGARAMAVHQANGVTWAITTNGSFGDHGSVLYSVMSRALATVAA
jgi:CubicO group peptidase (beta-lactamase class C family)